MASLALERALESQNIPAYPWYFETFDVKHKVSISAHQKTLPDRESNPGRLGESQES